MTEDNTLTLLVNQINENSDELITEVEIVAIIQKIAKIHRNKNFGFHTEEDIEGQVWIICLDRLQKYDSNKSSGYDIRNKIERFLNTTVKNRLINFHRDNYSSVNQKHKQTRMNLMNCLPIDGIDSKEVNRRFLNVDPTDNLIFEELKEFVEEGLKEVDPSGDLIAIYHSCIADENVTPYYRSKLNSELNKILQKWEDLNGE